MLIASKKPTKHSRAERFKLKFLITVGYYFVQETLLTIGIECNLLEKNNKTNLSGLLLETVSLVNLVELLPA